MSNNIHISEVLQDGYRAVQVGRYVAYGQITSGEEYYLDHAPTQEDFDVVATMLDCSNPDEIEAAVKAGDEEALQRWADNTELMDW